MWCGEMMLHPTQPLLTFMVFLLIGVFGRAVAEDTTPDPLIAYPGYTGEYPGFTLVLDDRFDSFDTEVWRKGDGAVGTEAMCRFQDQGVNVANGMLELVVQEGRVEAGWSEDHQRGATVMRLSFARKSGTCRRMKWITTGSLSIRVRVRRAYRTGCGA